MDPTAWCMVCEQATSGGIYCSEKCKLADSLPNTPSSPKFTILSVDQFLHSPYKRTRQLSMPSIREKRDEWLAQHRPPFSSTSTSTMKTTETKRVVSNPWVYASFNKSTYGMNMDDDC